MSEKKGLVFNQGGDSPRGSLTPLTASQLQDNELPCGVHNKPSKASLFCVTSTHDSDVKIKKNALERNNSYPPSKAPYRLVKSDRKHSVCWDKENDLNNPGASSFYDNNAFTDNDEDVQATGIGGSSGTTNSDEETKKSPCHMFIASGIEIGHEENCIAANNKDGLNGYKDCILSEVDIHRLSSPIPGSRERTDSLKNWLKDQAMMSSVTTMTTIVDETADAPASSRSVVCMNTSGPSKLEDTETKNVEDNIASTSKAGPVRMDSTLSGSSSMWSSEGRGCRICWNNEEKEPFIQPCLCSGSSANVHISCLKKWLQVTNQFKCEVCNHEYRSTSAFKPISKWSWKCSKTRYLSQLEATMILLGIVTPPLICGIVLCSQKIVEYISYPEHAWKTAGSFAALMTLVIASSLTYMTALVYFCRKFGAVCKQWMQTNQRTVVRLGDVEAVIEQTREIQQSRDNDLIDVEMYSVWSIT